MSVTQDNLQAWRSAVNAYRSKNPSDQEVANQKAVQELKDFFESPAGVAAKELLLASNGEIVFGDFDGNDAETIYVLNATGLRELKCKYHTAEKISDEQLTPESFIHCLTSPGITRHTTVERVVSFICSGIDEIVRKAPIGK